MEALKPNAGKEPTIVIIDDQPEIWQVLKTVMKFFRAKVRVLCFEDSQQALQLLKDRKVDLVFTDLNGPKIMYLGVFREMFQETCNASTPLIAMSGTHTLSPDERRGLTDFLEKPFDLDKLQAILDLHVPDEEQRA